MTYLHITKNFTFNDITSHYYNIIEWKIMWQQWVTVNFILQLIYCDSKNIYYGTKYLFKVSDEKN